MLLGGDPDGYDYMVVNPFAQHVVANVDVLSALMMTLFRGHRDRRTVIDVQWRRIRLRESEIGEDLPAPDDLFTGLCSSDILRFGGAVGDGALLLADPLDSGSSERKEGARGRLRIRIVASPIRIGEGEELDG